MVGIVAIGDNDVDCYLSDGRMYPGGNCYNVAVFARRYGARAAFVGAMADDPAGRLMRDVLATEGVAADRLRMVEGLTAYCVIGHRDGDRMFLSNDYGVSRFAPDADDIAYLAGFDAAHVGQSSGLDPWVPEFAARTRLSYDFSTRREATHIARIAPHCWLATLSTGDLDADAARKLMQQAVDGGAAWVLATRGAEGAWLTDGFQMHEISAHPARAVDTLGAGDSFIARVAVGLLRDEEPRATLAAAAEEAARTCSWFGAVGYGVPIDLPVDLPDPMIC